MGSRIMLQTIDNTQTCNFVRRRLSLPNMIHVFKSRRMRGAEDWHEWKTGEVLVEKPEEKKSLEDLGIDGRIILNWILKK